MIKNLPPTVQSVVVIALAACMTIFLIGLVAIAIIDSARGEMIAPWIAAALSAIATFGVALLTGHATTTQINGTATAAAQQSVAAMTASGIGANTGAIEKNTSAVQAQTTESKTHDSNH